MSTFHPFSRLPPEVRQRIWELSLEPRFISTIIKRDYDPDQVTGAEAQARTYAIFKVAPPVAFGVCRESRSCLLPQFVEVPSSTAEVTTAAAAAAASCVPLRVNFETDTVHCAEYNIPIISRAPWMARICKLVLDICDTDDLAIGLGWTRDSDFMEQRMACLRHLTIRYLEHGGYDWFEPFHDLLVGYYYRCAPSVTFDVRIINIIRPELGEVNRTNYMHIWRQERILELELDGRNLDGFGPEEDYNVLGHPHKWIHDGDDCLTKCGQATAST